MTVEVTTTNFEEIVGKASKPVLIEFWAVWCGPCRQVGPTIERLSKDYVDKAVVGKINVDEQIELAEKYRIMSIPTMYVFKGGEVVERLVGARPYEDLRNVLERHLN